MTAVESATRRNLSYHTRIRLASRFFIFLEKVCRMPYGQAPLSRIRAWGSLPSHPLKRLLPAQFLKLTLAAAGHGGFKTAYFPIGAVSAGFLIPLLVRVQGDGPVQDFPADFRRACEPSGSMRLLIAHFLSFKYRPTRLSRRSIRISSVIVPEKYCSSSSCRISSSSSGISCAGSAVSIKCISVLRSSSKFT